MKLRPKAPWRWRDLVKAAFEIPLEKDAVEVATVAARAAGLTNSSRLLLGFGGRRDGGRWHEKRWSGLEECFGGGRGEGGKAETLIQPSIGNESVPTSPHIDD